MIKAFAPVAEAFRFINPLILRAGMYQITPLNDLQCANNPAQPLDQMPDALQDQELTGICLSIAEAMS